MTNRDRLLKVINFLSEKTKEYCGRVSFPLYDTLTKSQWENCRSVHYIYDVAMKIIWLCIDIINSDKELEEHEPLKIDLLMTRLYEPYSMTLGYFYSYLSDWRANYIPRAMREQQPKHYYCSSLKYRFDLDYDLEAV